MLRKMFFTRWMLALVLGGALASAGCDLFTPVPAPAPEPGCVAAGGACELPGALCCEDLTCVDGVCVAETPVPECDDDNPCPAGQICENGVCVDEPIVGGPCTVLGADPDAGGTAYAASCVACHGEDASGPTSLLETEDITGAMQERFGGGVDHMGATLTDDEIRDVTCWVWQQQQG